MTGRELATGIRHGMAVQGLEGRRIGTVSGLTVGGPVSTLAPSPAGSSLPATPTASDVAAPPVEILYLLVQDPGTLGIASQTLRIPLTAVRTVDPERGITLSLGGEEARMRYGHRGLAFDQESELPY